jgi:hypothetical protein
MAMTVAERCDTGGCATLIVDTGVDAFSRYSGEGGRAVAERTAVSMGGCIASALMGESAVEVVGAVVGTVSPRAGGTLAAVAAG